MPIADCSFGTVRSLTHREVQFISKVLLVPGKKYVSMKGFDVYVADGKTPTHTIVQTSRTDWPALVKLVQDCQSSSSQDDTKSVSSSVSETQVQCQLKRIPSLRPEQPVFAPNLAESIERRKRTGCSGLLVAILLVVMFMLGGLVTFGSMLLVPVSCPVNHSWTGGVFGGTCNACNQGEKLPAATYNRFSPKKECTTTPPPPPPPANKNEEGQSEGR